MGWWRIQAQEHPPVPTGEAADAQAVEELFSQRRQEQRLKEWVVQYANPGNDPTRIRNGLGFYVELGVLYLQQHRLEEANQFFSELKKHSIEQYALLGRLGHAIVLGLQDRPAESNQLFMELFGDLKRPPKGRLPLALFLRENPQLAQWVAKALDFNAVNATPEAPFPPQLEPLRRPGTWPFGGRRPPIDKAAGKRT
jgi:hypothetical protein